MTSPPSKWPNLFPDPAVEAFNELKAEVTLLSGRVELSMRLLARITAKMDPAFTENPLDPEVRHRSNLLTESVIDNMKRDALAQAAHDPEAFNRLQRYFKDV